MRAPGRVRGAFSAIALLCAVAPLAPAGDAQSPSSRQSCGAVAISDTHGADRFSDIGGGSLADHYLGLVWQRCALGQVWKKDTCTGKPVALNWQESRQAAAQLNASGEAFFDDWRVPRIHELATLVAPQCRNPRIDLTLFPGTPAAPFWSATPAPPGGGEAAYMLSFGAEGVGREDTEARHLVRLVRSGL